jgi:hypothetical protein
MNVRGISVLAGLLASACAALPGADTARLPNSQFGAPVMTQNEVIALSSWALKDPATTRGNPERAARAIAAEDWLAGQTMLTPDFGQYQPGNEVSWYELRSQARGAIGVAPGTPSQVVVNQLFAAADALKAGDPAAAAAQLQPPAFTLGGDGTLAALGNLPPLPGWGRAYYELDRNENRSGGRCPFSPNC